MKYIKRLSRLYNKAITAKGKKGRRARRKWLLIDGLLMQLVSDDNRRSEVNVQDLIELVL